MSASTRSKGKQQMKMMLNTTRSLLLALGAAGTLAGLSGCRGDREEKPPRQFFPDMDDQPKWKPQDRSTFYSDGRTMRQPVQGTVPFGGQSFTADSGSQPWAAGIMQAREDILQDDPKVFEGLNGKEFVTTIPIEVTDELIRDGQKHFNISCSVCHGYLGDGQGQVGKVFTVAPANLHDPKYMMKGPTPTDPMETDGYIFSVIRNGVRSMPSYAHALTVRESWAVVAYVRALQISQLGTIDEVPEAQRARVEKEFRDYDAANPPQPTPPTAPANGKPPATQPSQPTPAPTGGAH